MLEQGLSRQALESLVAPHLYDPRWSSLVNRLMALNVTFKAGHHILPKVDQLSRPYAVVPRPPLFDRGVVDAALRMPADLKLAARSRSTSSSGRSRTVAGRDRRTSEKRNARAGRDVAQGRFDRSARERLLDGLAPYGIIRRSYLEGKWPGPDKKLLLASPRRQDLAAPPLKAWLRTVLAWP